MIRVACRADVPEILSLIRDLADYERAPEQAIATAGDLEAALFCPQPAVFAHIAEHSDSGGTSRVAGFALWFRNFSTWTGRHGIHLEDLYVRPELRGHGYGVALLAELAAIAVARGYSRFEWSVLDWNESAIAVYRAIGAEPMDGWTVQRLSGPALAKLAERRTGATDRA